jgi:hypothetical protein
MRNLNKRLEALESAIGPKEPLVINVVYVDARTGERQLVRKIVIDPNVPNARPRVEVITRES